MKKRSLIISIILVSVFIIWGILTMSGNTSMLDDNVSKYILSFRNDSLNIIMKYISVMCNTKTIILFCLLSLTLLIKKHYKEIYLVGLTVISTLVSVVVKYLTNRDRPTYAEHLITETTSSFPSGHSMVSITFYGFLIYLIWQSKLNNILKWVFSCVLGLLILCIGISRIYLGVHYPSDVIGGYLGGISVLVIATGYLERNKE